MNRGLFKITLRNMRMHKLRTFLTMLCVTLSMYMLCVFGIFASSILSSGLNVVTKLMGDYEISIRTISAENMYDPNIRPVDNETLKKIADDELVEKSFLQKQANLFDFENYVNIINSSGSSVRLTRINGDFFSGYDMLSLYCGSADIVVPLMYSGSGYEFIGDYPQREGEILLALTPENRRGINVGDVIDFSLCDTISSIKLSDEENEELFEACESIIEEYCITDAEAEEILAKADRENPGIYDREKTKLDTQRSLAEMIKELSDSGSITYQTISDLSVETEYDEFCDYDYYTGEVNDTTSAVRVFNIREKIFGDGNISLIDRVEPDEVIDECTGKFTVCGIILPHAEYYGGGAFLSYDDKTFDDWVDYESYAYIKLDKSAGRGNTYYKNLTAMLEKYGVKAQAVKYEDAVTCDTAAIDVNYSYMLMTLRGNTALATFALSLIPISIITLFFLGIARLSIDNAFEMSTKERVRQFSILRLNGASKKQIHKMVMTEGLVYTICSIPIGFLLAYLTGMIFVSRLKKLTILNGLTKELGFGISDVVELSVLPALILFFVVICALGVMISCYTSARWASKRSPIESTMYGNPKRKRHEGKGKRRLWLSKKLFGFSFGYASKSARRNKKSFRITVFSLMLGALVFILSSGLIEFFFSYELNENNLGSDAVVEIYSCPEEYDSADKVYEYYSSVADELEASGLFESIESEARFEMFLNNKKQLAGLLTQEGLESVAYSYIEDSACVSFCALSRAEFERRFAESTTVTYDELLESKGFIAPRQIGKYNSYSDETVFGSAFKEDASLYPFDYSGSVSFYNRSYSWVDKDMDFEIIGTYLLEGYLPDSPTIFMGGEYEILCSNFIELYFADENIGDFYDSNALCFSLNLNAKPDKTEETTGYLSDWGEKNNAYCVVYDNITEMSMQKSIIGIVKTAFYTIIAVLSLICFANVVNTINTSVLNRRRELAMLMAVGMSRNQVRRTVVFEGVIYMLLSVAIATAIATLGMNFIIAQEMNIGFVFPAAQVLIVTVAEAAVVILASLIPIKNLESTPIIEEIRKI